jgi:hypothetical protein
MPPAWVASWQRSIGMAVLYPRLRLGAFPWHAEILPFGQKFMRRRQCGIEWANARLSSICSYMRGCNNVISEEFHPAVRCQIWRIERKYWRLLARLCARRSAVYAIFEYQPCEHCQAFRFALLAKQAWPFRTVGETSIRLRCRGSCQSVLDGHWSLPRQAISGQM